MDSLANALPGCCMPEQRGTGILPVWFGADLRDGQDTRAAVCLPFVRRMKYVGQRLGPLAGREPVQGCRRKLG